MSKEQVAQRNRELMPNVAAMVDELREFFPNLKVLYAEDLETGRSVGKKPEPPTNSWKIPEGYRPSVQQKAQKRK